MHHPVDATEEPRYSAMCAELFPSRDGHWPEPGLGAPEDSTALEIRFDARAGVTAGGRPRPRTNGRDAGGLEALLDRVLRRDESALAELYGAFADRLLAAALRILHRPEVACEAVSSTFLHVWDHAADFDERRATVSTWLTMIVRSRAIDMLRQSRTRGRHECALTEAELTSTASNWLQPCNRVEQAECRVGLRRAMATLPPMQRQVLSLIFLEGHSHQEAAAHMGVPLGTLKSHSRRGLAALRGHAGLRAGCV